MAGLEDFPKIEDYKPIQIAGRGSFGTVYLVKNNIGNLRALKVITKNKFPNQLDFEREFEGIRKYEEVSLGSKYLISILHIGGNPKDDFYYYIMEAADAATISKSYTPDTLSSRLASKNPFLKSELISTAVDLCNGLAVLHKNGLLHRDIKASNVLFVNGNPKLGDPGTIQHIENASTFIGTSGYLAPEGSTSEQSDIFALGKLLYRMMTGHGVDQFPLLPDHFYKNSQVGFFRELNNIVCKACQANIQKRFKSTAHFLNAIKRIEKINHRAINSPKGFRLLKKKSLLLCIPIIGLLIFFFEPSKKENLHKNVLLDFIGSQNSKLSLEKIEKNSLEEWSFKNGFALVLNNHGKLIFSAIADLTVPAKSLFTQLDLFSYECTEKNYSFVWEKFDEKTRANTQVNNLLKARLGNYSLTKSNIKPTQHSTGENNLLYFEILPKQLNTFRTTKIEKSEIIPIVTSSLLSSTSSELELGNASNAFDILKIVQKFGYNGVELFIRVYKAFLLKGESLEALRVAQHISKHYASQIDYDTCRKLASDAESANLKKLSELWNKLSLNTINNKIIK